MKKFKCLTPVIMLILLVAPISKCKAQLTNYDSLIEKNNVLLDSLVNERYKVLHYVSTSGLVIYSNDYAVTCVEVDHYYHIDKNGQKLYYQTYPTAYAFNNKGRAVVVKAYNLEVDLVLYVVINTKGDELISEWGRLNDYNANGCIFPPTIEEYMK